jgi:hypothetical protein
MSEHALATRPQVQDPGSDRRAEERRPVNNSGAIFALRGQTSVAVTIVDRSEGGAKLKINGNPGLPNVILLVDYSTNSVFECEVRWRQGGNVGVQIIDAYGPGRRRRFFATHPSAKPATPRTG